MSTKTPSRVVFVGNIPYGEIPRRFIASHLRTADHVFRPGLSEEQISELFSSAGQVLNFRLVYDRDTGRPKGFGFAEYPDAGKQQPPAYLPCLPVYPVSCIAPLAVLSNWTTAIPQIPQHQQSGT